MACEQDVKPETRPYRPSNGTEGDIFYSAWCMKCRHEDHDRHPCEIFSATLALDATDPDYPKEWVEGENGPRCTKFEEGAPLTSADEKYLNWKAQRDLCATHQANRTVAGQVRSPEGGATPNPPSSPETVIP